MRKSQTENKVENLRSKLKEKLVIKEATLKDIKVGAKLKTYYNENNPSNESFEIRGIVDERYVCRRWRKRTQSWYYFVESLYSLQLSIEMKHLYLR